MSKATECFKDLRQSFMQKAKSEGWTDLYVAENKIWGYKNPSDVMPQPYSFLVPPLWESQEEMDRLTGGYREGASWFLELWPRIVPLDIPCLLIFPEGYKYRGWIREPISFDPQPERCLGSLDIAWDDPHNLESSNKTIELTPFTVFSDEEKTHWNKNTGKYLNVKIYPYPYSNLSAAGLNTGENLFTVKADSIFMTTAFNPFPVCNVSLSIVERYGARAIA